MGNRQQKLGKQNEERNDAVVLITGCTSGGIGHALALELGRRGCRVVATARSETAVAKLNHDDRIATALQMDVQSDASVSDAVATAVAAHGRIDVLVNNAGVHCVSPLVETPLRLIQNTFETNVFGLMRVTKEVTPHMIKRRKGKIVNIGSVTAINPSPWVGAYAASKAAIHSLSDALRVELKPFGIDVVTVVPGVIKSNIGIHSAEVFKTVPEYKLYKPFEEAIHRRITYSQESGSTPTDVFASKTADVILRKHSPAWFSYGKYSTIASVLGCLPLCIKDFVARRNSLLQLRQINDRHGQAWRKPLMVENL